MLRSGVAAVALAGARPPSGDLEERQLVNLVEEMALAAGVPPPRVMVVDSPDANAAVAGRSVRDVTIIVPRVCSTSSAGGERAPSSPTCWPWRSTATCGWRW